MEPFVLPFYFGENRRSVQFEHRQDMASNWDHIPSDSECLANITADYSAEGKHTVFVKDHAIYVWPDKVPHHILCSSANTFIIRNPTKAIKSLYRQTLADFNDSFWDRLVPEEAGFEEQWRMYNLITHDLKQKAMVIDADDLMANPKGMLMEYCASTGLEFDEKMLDWNNDADKAEKPWDFIPDTWMCDVKQTSGFRAKDKVHDEGIVYPQLVTDTIDECMPWYQKLYDNRFVQ